MKDEVEETLGCSLLASDLELALLKALEVIHAVLCQEVETVLDTFDFLDYKLDYLQRVALLMDLFNDRRFFDED